MLKKKTLILIVIIIIVFVSTYAIVGRKIPIHVSSMKVGSERIYYRETSKLIQCDLAYLDVEVYQGQDYIYFYDLISTGNGSCRSDLYIWDNFNYFTLSDALEEGIVSMDDFLDSDLVKKRQVTS